MSRSIVFSQVAIGRLNKDFCMIANTLYIASPIGVHKGLRNMLSNQNRSRRRNFGTDPKASAKAAVAPDYAEAVFHKPQMQEIGT